MALKKQKAKIFEGLQEGDLRDLVLPTISIDFYYPKSGKNSEVIVVAFFIKDADAARDFNNFVAKTSSKILDVELSPAPTTDGHWVVFVELLRDISSVNEICTILNEIKSVTKLDNFTAKIYKVNKEVEANEENLKKYVNWGGNFKKNLKKLSIKKWLELENSNAIKLVENFEENSKTGKKFIIKYFGQKKKLPNFFKYLTNFGYTNNLVQILSRMLGKKFEILSYNSYIFILKENSKKFLILKCLDKS